MIRKTMKYPRSFVKRGTGRFLRKTWIQLGWIFKSELIRGQKHENLKLSFHSIPKYTGGYHGKKSTETVQSETICPPG